MKDLPVRVVRSRQRKKTVSAEVVKGVLLIRIPAKMSGKEEVVWVERMKKKLSDRRKRKPQNDAELGRRAEKLIKRYFGKDLKVSSITYSDRQNKRHGSCSNLSGDIRISEKIKAMPNWVLDYVIVHELAHIIHPNHSKEFWELVNRYRYAERARGFLIAKDMEGN